MNRNYIPRWKQNRLLAQRVLKELKEALGNKCASCGTEENLEFDCIEPQGDKHHKWETNRRAYFYREQHKAGNLQLLCSGSALSCHGRKSAGEQYWQEAKAFNDCPF